VTSFGLFLTPIFYVLLRTLVSKRTDQLDHGDPSELEIPDEFPVEAEVTR
jgi:hypothetical protein